MIIRTTIITILIFLTGCSGYTYNGLRYEDIKNPSLSIVAGVIASYAVHTISHMAYAEFADIDYDFDAFSEMFNGHVSDHDAAWFGRAGFIGQLSIGYGMKCLGIENDFTRGYNSAAMFQITTYPAWRSIIEGDDFELIDRSGNSTLEWAIYSGLAVGLNFKKKSNFGVGGRDLIP